MKSRDAAFTLVEVLAGAALFALLMVAVLSAVNSSTSIVTGTSQRLEVRQTAREILDMFQRDISICATPISSDRPPSLHLTVNPPHIHARFKNSDSAFWQIPLSSVNDSRSGNMAVVGYYVIRYPSESRFQLRKVLIDSQSSSYKLYSPNDWIDDAICNDHGPATTAADESNQFKGWIADGVLGLWIRCLDKDGALITQSTAPYRFDSRAYGHPPRSRLPAYIEVSLVCVSTKELPRLTTLPPFSPTAPATPGVSSLHADAEGWVDTIRSANPGVKSVAAFTRKFRIYQGD